MRSLPSLVVALSLAAAPVLAYPTSLNLIPSADVMDARTVRVALELDGHATPFSEDAGLYLCTQFGVTDRLEIGFDLNEINYDSDWAVNAKWQVVPENDSTPAVAIGVWDATRWGALSDWYVVASKDAGNCRLHGGFRHNGPNRGFVGAEYFVTDRFEFMADWTTGHDEYLAGGAFYDLGHGLGTFAYYARSNSTRDGDFVGLNAVWEGPW